MHVHITLIIIILVALSPLASLLSMLNLFSNNRTTYLCFLHVEVAISLLTKCIRNTNGES